MSYCRFSDGDVYVFDCDGGIECCGCRLRGTFTAETPEEMISHLAEHKRAGHDVPADVIPALWDEIEVPTVEHDPRTCPACADVASAEERASWVEALNNPVRVRRYRKGAGSGVVVSVRMDKDEWEDVASAAEKKGLLVSQFVRETAVRAARAAS